MQETNTWASRVAPQISPQRPVAYFCIEYGFDHCLPIYSGGLGVLAADHLKSASDLGLVFVEDYDLHIAEKLVQGVNVWLNTPRQPQEASGTSGQKVSFNGGINCSVLDGWWCEAYQTGLEVACGWTIGDNHDMDDSEAQDLKDAESLYHLLEKEIIPRYYDQDKQGIPFRWIEMMKALIKTIAPFFNTDCMVAEYVTQMYLPSSTPLGR